MNKKEKRSTAILRTLINGLIIDQNVLANSNADILLKNHPIIDKACRGYFVIYL